MPTPYVDKYTYDSEQIPFVGNHTNRLASAAKDQVFYNVIVDVLKSPVSQTPSIWLNKRGGFTASSTVAAGVGRGIYYWARTAKTYCVIDNKLYSGAGSILTLTTSTGTCWFVEASGTSDSLIMGDGTKLYTISLVDAVTDIGAGDADMPAGPLTPTTLDGYVFIIKSGTDEIWNSDVNVPTSWTANSFVSAEMYPDNLVALARQLNYVVGFGLFSIELLFDNANATGSPLRRSETSALKVGLAARDSLGQTDKRIYFVGQSNTGEPSVWVLDGLSAGVVSNEFIDKILVNEGSSLTNVTGWVCHHKGHTLYVLNLTSRTLVYDCDEKIWFDWSINSASTHAVLPFKYMTQGPNNTILILHNTDGKIYKLDKDTFQDDAGVILIDIITSRMDFKSIRQKRQLKLELIADKESAGTVTVTWSDDDYQTWNAARTLDLTTRPYTKAGGIFRRRAYRFQHSSNNPFRAQGLEIDYSEGFS